MQSYSMFSKLFQVWNDFILLLKRTIITGQASTCSLKSRPKFLPRDAAQSAVLLRQSRPSVRDVEVSWSHRLEIFKNNLTVRVRYLRCSLSADPNIRYTVQYVSNLLQREHPKILTKIDQPPPPVKLSNWAS